MKKLLLVLCSCALLTSCGNLELKHFSPIPTPGNQGGLFQLGQDILRGDWDRFKDPKVIYMKKPLKNEWGEKIEIDGFKLKETEDYKITACEFGTASPHFIFQFEIKDPNKKLSYVMIYQVEEGRKRAFIDETVKDSTPERFLKYNIKANTEVFVENGKQYWIGTLGEIPESYKRYNGYIRYLFKFVIVDEDQKITVIYQPASILLNIK